MNACNLYIYKLCGFVYYFHILNTEYVCLKLNCNLTVDFCKILFTKYKERAVSSILSVQKIMKSKSHFFLWKYDSLTNFEIMCVFQIGTLKKLFAFITVTYQKLNL